MENVRAKSIGSPRFRAALLRSFAFLALALATIGVHAMMSFVIGRRASQMGLRVALGAERSSIFRAAIARAARFGIIGPARRAMSVDPIVALRDE